MKVVVRLLSCFNYWENRRVMMFCGYDARMIVASGVRTVVDVSFYLNL